MVKAAIDRRDLRIFVQWYRRPMTVEVTHLPTGLVVTFADEFMGNMSSQECVDKAIAQLIDRLGGPGE